MPPLEDVEETETLKLRRGWHAKGESLESGVYAALSSLDPAAAQSEKPFSTLADHAATSRNS